MNIPHSVRLAIAMCCGLSALSCTNASSDKLKISIESLDLRGGSYCAQDERRVRSIVENAALAVGGRVERGDSALQLRLTFYQMGVGRVASDLCVYSYSFEAAKWIEKDKSLWVYCRFSNLSSSHPLAANKTVNEDLGEQLRTCFKHYQKVA